MSTTAIVKVKTQWGLRFRLQVTLPEDVVNVRIHACKDCNFIEWSTASGEKIAETELGENFIAELSAAITRGENRCLPSLVSEGLQALGAYGDTKLFI